MQHPSTPDVYNNTYPVIYREIERNSGKSSLEKTDSTAKQTVDSLSFYRDLASKSTIKETKIFDFWQILAFALIAGIILLIFIKFKK